MWHNAFKGLLAGTTLLMATSGFANFLPPNNLYLQDARFKAAATGISEATFNEVIDQVNDHYNAIVNAHGGKLTFQRNWTDSTVNAFADRKGTTWTVAMFGGLARRPEITKDGFMIVVCHELGHQLGGFPFASSWAANEGEADYFATQACAREVWSNDKAANAASAATVNPTAKTKCNGAWPTADDRNLCYRISQAAKSSADLLAALDGQPVSFDKTDKKVVTKTDNGHPEAQCRLDTYIAASLCDIQFDINLIPGISLGDQRNGADAETETATVTCHQKNVVLGDRPTCWFKPRT